MSAEDLEKYETEMELQLYREYRDVVLLFSHVVETERRFYLTNQVELNVRTADNGEVYFEVTMQDAWVWDMYRPARLAARASTGIGGSADGARRPARLSGHVRPEPGPVGELLPGCPRPGGRRSEPDRGAAHQRRRIAVDLACHGQQRLPCARERGSPVRHLDRGREGGPGAVRARAAGALGPPGDPRQRRSHGGGGPRPGRHRPDDHLSGPG